MPENAPGPIGSGVGVGVGDTGGVGDAAVAPAGVGVGDAAPAAPGVGSGVGGRCGRWARNVEADSNDRQTKTNDRRNFCTERTPWK